MPICDCRKYQLRTYDEVYRYAPLNPPSVDRIENRGCTYYGSIWRLARDHAESLTQIQYDDHDVNYAIDHVESLDAELDYDNGDHLIRNIYVVLPDITNPQERHRLHDIYHALIERNLRRLRG